MNVPIDPKLEKDFRIVAGAKFGFKKGALGKAVNEALQDWVEKNANKRD